ncbi:MAG: GC-type dockerin domain-anchored protein [Phycisphaerales bacterium]
MRATMLAAVVGGLGVAGSGAAAFAQGTYSTNIGAAVFYGGGTQTFHGDNRTSQFPMLGISTCGSVSANGSAAHESFMSSVDRGLIEHSANGAGSRHAIASLPGRYDGVTWAGSGTSSASWSDVVISYTGTGQFENTIPVSASFSVIGIVGASGENVISAGYTINASASIAGQGGSFSAHIGGGNPPSSTSGTVSIVGALVPVNQPFTVSMSLGTPRNPSGVAFGGAYDHSPGGASWHMNASIATNGPSFGEPLVFVLPEGYTINSPSMGIVNNRWLGRTIYIPCGPSDVGSAGGVDGADSALDNNDFIAYINRYFAADTRADVGAREVSRARTVSSTTTISSRSSPGSLMGVGRIESEVGSRKSEVGSRKAIASLGRSIEGRGEKESGG